MDRFFALIKEAADAAPQIQTPTRTLTHSIINQPHQTRGSPNLLAPPITILPRIIGQDGRQSAPRQIPRLESGVTQPSRTNDSPNPLASPVSIVSRPNGESRPTPRLERSSEVKTIAVRRRHAKGQNPHATDFIPSWRDSPDLFSPYNPYKYFSPGPTPFSTPGLITDYTPISESAPCQSSNYTHKLTSKCVAHVKAELMQPPPVLVPHEHKKRPSPGLFLYGSPPPGLTRHSAYSPHHPGGIAPLPLPPVEISYNPSLGHHRYYSQAMITKLGLRNLEYLNGCEWAWEFIGSKVEDVTSNIDLDKIKPCRVLFT